VPLEDVVRMKDHGVTPEYLADRKEILKDLTVAEVVRLRDHGITPGFVNHARSRGFKTTDPDELVRLKNGGLYKKRQGFLTPGALAKAVSRAGDVRRRALASHIRTLPTRG